MGLGRGFGWLWAAYAASALGTSLAFDAFPLIAILVLDAGPAQVSALAAAGLAVGAAVAVPLGAWVEFRRKRPVMIAMDLVRFAALMSIPVAYALGWLGFAQLVAVSVVVATADLTFSAASGAYLKALVPQGDLLVANGRFEATAWTATAVGPPLGTTAIGLFGPVTTVVANAVSYLLSAIGVRASGGGKPEGPPPARAARAGGAAARLRAGEVLEGWRYLLRSPELRPLFLNAVLVNALIMAAAPPLAVLMLGDLGFAPWQYGLVFTVPCLGGLIGSRVARGLVARFGSRRVMLAAGVARACWPVGLAFTGPGVGGLVLVGVVEFGLIACMGVFNPVLATCRLERTPTDRVARTLSAWSVSSKATIAVMTGLWGVLAGAAGPRAAIAASGVLLLATPLLFLLLPSPPRAGAGEKEGEARLGALPGGGRTHL
jgi:hypothetical protein